MLQMNCVLGSQMGKGCHHEHMGLSLQSSITLQFIKKEKKTNIYYINIYIYY